MVKKKQNKYKKRSKKSKKKSFLPFLLFILIILLIILIIFIFYSTYIFPKTLNKNIKNDLIALLIPKSIDESENDMIFKLNTKPSEEIKKNIYNWFYEKYDLKIKFEEIEEKSIYRIDFFSNDKIYSDIKKIYILWEEKKFTDNESIKKKEIIEFEKHEEKNYQEKQEKLEKPKTEKFQYCKQKETPEYNTYKIAIIIDDVGYSYNLTYEYLSLGFPITLSIIPDMIKSKEFYELFRKYGYSLILHIPMEPIKGSQYVEKNAILSNMTDIEIKNQIEFFFKTYPNIIGANNHMGSKIIQDNRIMEILMNKIASKKIFWLDSMTNPGSISKNIAEKYNVKYYERDVFLDNEKNEKYIRNAMNQLINKAKLKGFAVGIGHVQTKNLISILKEYYQNKKKYNIEFVFLNKIN